jgi:hypothetical protein
MIVKKTLFQESIPVRRECNRDALPLSFGTNCLAVQSLFLHYLRFPVALFMNY